MTYILDGVKRDINIPGSKTKKGLKIVKKAINKYARCTILGFAYDSRKIKEEWVR